MRLLEQYVHVDPKIYQRVLLLGFQLRLELGYLDHSPQVIFLGEYSPVSVGDYGVGPNSTLPTLGDARLSSGLDTNTFLKTISYEMLSPEGLERVAPTVMALSKIEGLPAHGTAVRIRTRK